MDGRFHSVVISLPKQCINFKLGHLESKQMENRWNKFEMRFKMFAVKWLADTLGPFRFISFKVKNSISLADSRCPLPCPSAACTHKWRSFLIQFDCCYFLSLWYTVSDDRWPNIICNSVYVIATAQKTKLLENRCDQLSRILCITIFI